MNGRALFLKLLVRSGVARFLPGAQRRLEGGAEFLRYYADRLLGAPFADLERAAEALEAHAPDAIDLAQGSPHFDVSPSGSTKLPADRRGWPPVAGLAELRIAVAEHLLPQNLAFRPGEEVLITAGALGAVQIALDAFVNRGDRVVLPGPISPLYPLAVRARGASVRWLPTWMEEGRTRLRLDHLARALRGARLLVLCSPANPTGGIVAPEDLEQIAWWANRHDVLVLSDEVFGRFRYEVAPVSMGSLPSARERTLTVGSVSKGHALASARVGWLATHRHLLRPCLATAALRCPFVPTLSQQIALGALRAGDAPFAPILAQFEARRRYTVDRLRAFELAPDWPAGGLFVWLPVKELGVTGRAFAEGLSQRHKVCVVPGDLFGPLGTHHVRLSYALEDGRLEEGLHRLGEHVRALRGAPAAGKKVAA